MADVSRSRRSHGSHAVGHMVGLSTECNASDDEPVAGRLERGDSCCRRQDCVSIDLRSIGPTFLREVGPYVPLLNTRCGKFVDLAPAQMPVALPVTLLIGRKERDLRSRRSRVSVTND